MYTFVPNKPFSSLLKIPPTSHIFFKTFNSEFQGIQVWFIDQNSRPLGIEGRIDLTLVIKKNRQRKSKGHANKKIHIPKSKTTNY